MPAESHYIDFRRSRIHYLRMGSGTEWLFCFHGYGETARSFSLLEPALGARFTLIAIDLPFHGQTVWEEGLLFAPADLLQIIAQIKPAGTTMHLFGYSMGGRVAMQLLQEIPAQVTRLVLVAPDGLHKNKWQWLATRTAVGNRLFRYFMAHPKLALKAIDLGGATGIYNKSLHKFVHYYLDDACQRQILYQRWTTMRKFRPAKKRLLSIIQKNNIPVRLLFGKYDRVILTTHGTSFSESSNGLVQVTEIEAGHQLLKPKHLAQILALFTS